LEKTSKIIKYMFVFQQKSQYFSDATRLGTQPQAATFCAEESSFCENTD